MTAIEHKEIKGLTLRNLIVTIVGTASIVASVMTTYFQLKNDIHDLTITQETQNRVYDIRLKVLETETMALQQRMDQIKKAR